jgi:hypothetical protein
MVVLGILRAGAGVVESWRLLFVLTCDLGSVSFVSLSELLVLSFSSVGISLLLLSPVGWKYEVTLVSRVGGTVLNER